MTTQHPLSYLALAIAGRRHELHDDRHTPSSLIRRPFPL